MLVRQQKICILFLTFIFALVPLLLTACSSPQPLNREHLNPENPFALGWKSSNIEAEKTQISSRRHNSQVSRCKNQYARLEKFLSTDFTDEYLEYCKSWILIDESVSKNTLPRFFRDSSVTVTRNHEFNPVMYELSYGHQIYPANTLETSRIQKYNTLKNALTIIMGEPQLWGDLWEYGDDFFVQTEQEKASCAVWIKNKIAVYLCSERLKYIDGIETSLIFINIESYPYRKAIAEELNFDLELSPSLAQNKFIGSETYIETLLNWTGANQTTDFPKCEKDTNLPLSERAKISVDTQKLLQPLLDKYSGESLMEYIYENVSEIEELVQGANIDNVIMYLIFNAANDGSAGAYNEIGGSLLHCNQGVQQDFVAARELFEKAAAKNDPMSMRGLAFLIILGEYHSQTSEQTAIDWIKRCAELNPDLCSADLAALQWVESLHFE